MNEQARCNGAHVMWPIIYFQNPPFRTHRMGVMENTEPTTSRGSIWQISDLGIIRRGAEILRLILAYERLIHKGNSRTDEVH